MSGAAAFLRLCQPVCLLLVCCTASSSSTPLFTACVFVMQLHTKYFTLVGQEACSTAYNNSGLITGVGG